MTLKRLFPTSRWDHAKRWPLRSIALKLSLGFLVVGVMGVVLVVLSIRFSTQREFDRFLDERVRSDSMERLSEHYRTNGGWDGLPEALAADPNGGPGLRRPPFTVIDAQRVVIYSQGKYEVGEQIPRFFGGYKIPILVDGETVGWLIPETIQRPPEPGTPEANFFSGLTQAILYSGLIAAAVAIVVSVYLARSLTRPIRELTAATQAMANGDLNTQVTVRSRDELGELATSFNRMSTDLARANSLRRQMTADVAHELRTPLSVILGYTEALSEGKLPGSLEAFDAMHSEAQHLQRLIEDLRTLSLADAGELPLMRQSVSIQVLLKRVASAYMPQAQHHNITIQVQTPSDGMPEIAVDPDRMVQVLGNLVSNALRYTPEGGRIVIAAEPGDGNIRLSVQDNGAGISPEDLPYIFERFYRGDKARYPDTNESGLGLAIARSIVEAHGGTIAVSSTVGQGTTFTITLA